MLDQKSYARFAIRANSIVRKCFVGHERPSPWDSEKYDELKGFSPYTKDIPYYYSKKVAIECQDDLFKILQQLPKTDIWGEFDGTILYTDLLSDTKNPNILKSQLTLADQFSHLLVVSRLGFSFNLENNNTQSPFTNVSILPFYRDDIYTSPKEEPDGRDSH